MFDPYEELYVWLGQIRDSQLPAKMFIDEEGRGVELLVERVDDELLHFHVEPYLCDDQETYLSVTLGSHELISAFCNGIIDFVKSEYQLPEWSYIDHLSNINWEALLLPKNSSQNWQARLAMYGGGHGRVPETGRNSLGQSFTTKQQWLIVLHDVLAKAVQLAVAGQPYEAYTLVSLYQHLLIDLALDEFDPSWYEKRRSETNQKTEYSRPSKDKRNPERKSLEVQARLSTLKIGQLVDGRVRQIKPYGVFVDIGGIHTLLTISTISQASIEHPDQVFQVGDWVRAMIVWMDVGKRRVLLSTSDLEPEPGDMLDNPLKVYEKAEEMANRYCQNVLSRLLNE